MAKTKLTPEQRATLLEWLAADYDWRLIQEWFKERGWPEFTRATASYYRVNYASTVSELREERYRTALSSGLAKKEERVERLKKHADKLEVIKWEPDKNGRMWNEKAWRETLADIASELGHRKQVVEVDDWRSKVVGLLKDGRVTPADVVNEFGHDLATELFIAAGVPIGASREIGASVEADE